MSDSARKVLFLSGDLFFTSSLRSAAEAAGFTVEIDAMPNAGRFLPKLASEGYFAVVIDLESPGLDVASVVEALPVESRPRTIAFGPHVQVARLEAARQAGCDRVVSRAQISTKLAALLNADD
ncbi:MAG: histidine kinase [Maioricimonas sp. JB049]